VCGDGVGWLGVPLSPVKQHVMLHSLPQWRDLFAKVFQHSQDAAFGLGYLLYGVGVPEQQVATEYAGLNSSGSMPDAPKLPGIHAWAGPTLYVLNHCHLALRHFVYFEKAMVTLLGPGMMLGRGCDPLASRPSAYQNP
jgi:hypothetical protein